MAARLLARHAAPDGPQKRQRFKFSRPRLVRKAKAPEHPTDKYIKPLADAITKTTSDFADSLSPEQLSFDYKSNAARALDLSALDTALTAALLPITTNLLELGVTLGATDIFDFALPNLEAANAAQLYTSWLVKEISDQTRSALQTVMYRAFTEGLAPKQAGKLVADALRGEPLAANAAGQLGISTVGLNARLGNAVYNYAQSLVSQGYSQASAIGKAQDYADRLLQYRGNIIARTETIRASNMGQQSLWNAAIDGGYLDTSKATKVWSAAAQNRTCEQCMGIDGQEVGVRDSFQTPWGDIPYPPGHTNCRCSAILNYPDRQPPRVSAVDRLARATSSQLTVAASSLPSLD